VSESDNINSVPRPIRKLQRLLGTALSIVAVVVLVRTFSEGRPQGANAQVGNLAAPPKQSKISGQTKTKIVNPVAASANLSPSSPSVLLEKTAETKPLASPVIVKEETPEVCGLSQSEVEAYLKSGDADAMDLSKKSALVLADIARDMIQSKKISEQTAGLYLTAQLAGWNAMEAERLKNPGCEPSAECSSKPFYAMVGARAASAEPLIKLATSSNDPSVYAAALYACIGTKVGSCENLSYTEWADMEPDNAAAWLSAASEAESRKDPSAQAVALQRAVEATRYDFHLPRLAGIVETESAQAQGPLSLSPMYALLFSANAVAGIPLFGGILKHCSREEVLDSARLTLCDGLAKKMAENDESLATASIARVIGERVGWSTERLQSLKDEYTVATGQIFEGMTDKNMLSCEMLKKSNERMLSVLQIGERAAAREAAEKRGKSMAEMAQLYRNSTPGNAK
jgi:hypothetical protein